LKETQGNDEDDDDDNTKIQLRPYPLSRTLINSSLGF